VVKKDGVSLPRVRAPQNDEVGVLNLAKRTRPASCTKDRRQTGDAGGVSSAITTVDVVGAHDGPGELLGKKIQLVRRLRAAKHSEALRSVPLGYAPKVACGAVKSLTPTGGTKLPVFPNQRMGDSIFHRICHISLPIN
jgi:hypothetical protein